MPTERTRLCSYCRRYRPSDQCTCITEETGSRQPDGTPITRNTFFCQQCVPYNICNCFSCGSTERQSNALWVGSLSHEFEAAITAAGRPYHRMPGRIRSEHLCNTCSAGWGEFRCHGCNHLYYSHLGHEPAMMHENGPVCSNCAPRFRPCCVCNKAIVAEDQRRVPYNSHCPEQGHVCGRCRTSHLEPTTFKMNKHAMTCGFEFEFIMPLKHKNELDLKKLGIIKYDGSIAALDQYVDGGWGGWEFNSRPAVGDTLVNAIYDSIKAIGRAGGFVNKTCGIHFHFGMQHFSSQQRDNMVEWWRVFEPVLFDLVTSSRRNNRYCGRGANGDRYRALNWHNAYNEHGTFEVRMHHATMDPDVVWEFCDMLLSMFTTLPLIDAPTRSEYADFTKRELAMLLFQQCAMTLSMRKRIVRRIRTINSYQYRTHHWRRPSKLPPPTPTMTEPRPMPFESFEYAHWPSMAARHGRA
jgi:hypothetical protein